MGLASRQGIALSDTTDWLQSRCVRLTSIPTALRVQHSDVLVSECSYCYIKSGADGSAYLKLRDPLQVNRIQQTDSRWPYHSWNELPFHTSRPEMFVHLHLFAGMWCSRVPLVNRHRYHRSSSYHACVQPRNDLRFGIRVRLVLLYVSVSSPNSQR